MFGVQICYWWSERCWSLWTCWTVNLMMGGVRTSWRTYLAESGETCNPEVGRDVRFSALSGGGRTGSVTARWDSSAPPAGAAHKPSCAQVPYSPPDCHLYHNFLIFCPHFLLAPAYPSGNPSWPMLGGDFKDISHNVKCQRQFMLMFVKWHRIRCYIYS